MGNLRRIWWRSETEAYACIVLRALTQFGLAGESKKVEAAAICHLYVSTGADALRLRHH